MNYRGRSFEVNQSMIDVSATFWFLMQTTMNAQSKSEWLEKHNKACFLLWLFKSLYKIIEDMHFLNPDFHFDLLFTKEPILNFFFQ